MIGKKRKTILTLLKPHNGGFKSTGYGIGVVAFEAVLAFFTAGTGTAARSLSKFTTQSFQLLKSLKTPDGFRDLVSRSLVYAENTVIGLKCRILYAGCFVKNTPVLMGGNPFKNVAPAMALATMPLVAPIQDVKIDDMVKAFHHEDILLTVSNDDDLYVSGWQDYDYLDITPETWQIGEFIITEEDGSVVEIEANRPKSWYEDYGLKEKGDRAYIIIEEMGVSDYAVLQSIRSTVVDTRDYALNQSGKVDRPVITTYKRIENEVWDYTFSNGKTIGCTPNHPFYCVDRQEYVPISELTTGESVMTSGEREVKFIGGKAKEKGERADSEGADVWETSGGVNREAGGTAVYNMEVWREHNYYVGFESGVDFMLVHNTCIDDLFKLFNDIIEIKGIKHILRGEINGAGKATGVHHISAINMGTARKVAGTNVPGPYGLYKVKVEVKDANGTWVAKTNNGGYSTFFPDDWDQVKVLDEIKYAKSNKSHVSGNEYMGMSSDGNIEIHMYLKSDGTIISAFPQF